MQCATAVKFRLKVIHATERMPVKKDSLARLLPLRLRVTKNSRVLL